MKIKTSSFAAAVAVLLALCLVFMAPVGAAEWTGTGSSEQPLEISTADDLRAVEAYVTANTVTANTGTYYLKLTSNIDLNDQEWDPIDLDNYPGSSVYFDGAGYKIKNLQSISDIEYVGLFGWITSQGAPTLSIKNLTLENVTLSNTQNDGSYSSIGAFVGWCESGNLIVENCNVTGKISISGNKYTGGIIGYSSSSSGQLPSIKLVTITITEGDGIVGPKAGGLIGMSYKTSISEIESDVPVSSSEIAGGLIGRLGIGDEISINSVSVTGDVTGTSSDAVVGALLGQLSSSTDVSDLSITDCSASGMVNGVETVSLIGGMHSSSADIDTSNLNEKVDATYIVPEDADPDYISKIDTTYGGEISYPQTSTPSQPATSSSSSGTPTPGAYYNYPRTVSDGGLVEFGTSKVVKSVTLPAGSSGKVNLHIDSTAYWPLSLDSEFTFDISVDNLGEGTSYISFKIAESKLTALELTAADVGVYHNVNGEWVKLVVTYTIEDGDVIYTAETDSFSPFKLVIEEGAAVQKEEVTPSEPVVDEPVIPDVPQDVPGEVLPEIPDIQDEPETPASPAPVLGLLAALGAAVVLRRK